MACTGARRWGGMATIRTSGRNMRCMMGRKASWWSVRHILTRLAGISRNSSVRVCGQRDEKLKERFLASLGRAKKLFLSYPHFIDCMRIAIEYGSGISNDLAINL